MISPKQFPIAQKETDGEKDMADVGKNIKKIRKEKNLTQDDLAERLHCTRQTISNYENGKSEPNIELLIEIAGVLDVEVNDLIYGLKKKENRRKHKAKTVIVLMAAIIMLAATELLMPAARRYAQIHFALEPNLFLRITFRPIALTLFGWGLVDTIMELFEIPMEKASYRKFARFAYYVLLVGVSVLILVTLWMGVEMVWSWYMSDKILKVRDSFSSFDIPHLIPGALQRVIFEIYLFSNGAEVWYCPLLGAAFAACKKMKN